MEKELLGYHGTSQRNLDFIKKYGFRKKVSDNSFPNDLGFGAYFYLDRVEKEAKDNAHKYVIRYKTEYFGKIVIEVPISVDENKILDFNIKEAMELLEEFIRENGSRIKKELEKYDHNSKAFKRGNFDGVVIDLFIEYFNMVVDIVLKDTFTSFDGYRMSNFVNGREVCVKNKEVIDTSNIKVVERII